MPATEDDGTLIVHRLPCSEDVRDFSFPSLKEDTPAQRSAVSQVSCLIGNYNALAIVFIIHQDV